MFLRIRRPSPRPGDGHTHVRVAIDDVETKGQHALERQLYT